MLLGKKVTKRVTGGYLVDDNENNVRDIVTLFFISVAKKFAVR